ncbi:hypothetical protein WS86_25310 [Burkholderia savannae]|nr:hypothetical protein WS86_25310 [Burkholderia savannae]
MARHVATPRAHRAHAAPPRIAANSTSAARFQNTRAPIFVTSNRAFADGHDAPTTRTRTPRPPHAPAAP